MRVDNMINYRETFDLSYWRTLETTIDGVPFLDAFYERFLSSSNEVAELFANTDFEQQEKMFALSLAYLASFDSEYGPSSIMKRLAIRHRELNVKPHLYPLWVNSLLETVKEYDPEYNDDVHEAWRRVLTPGIDFMVSKCSE
jgi:hemoglobin-like flavoprotein